MADDENAAEDLQEGEGEVSVSELQQENPESVPAVEVQPSQVEAPAIEVQSSQVDAPAVEVQPSQNDAVVIEVQPSEEGTVILEVQESQDGLTAEDNSLEAAEEKTEAEDELEGLESKGKSGSVKFVEPPKLNESQELERQFDELMEAPDLMSTLDMLSEAMVNDENVDDTLGEPDLFQEEEMEMDEEECDEEMYAEGGEEEMDGQGPRVGRKSTSGKGSFDITPEYIFNELKVADAMKDEAGQNIQSFIISKSFSSENVVVLLNLRRMNDGEWALDKTIAQGLRQETYGGVVSIDQYEFTDQPPAEAEENEKPKAAQSPRRSSGSQGESSGTFMEILKKLEDHVADVNKDIIIARKLIKEIPPCVPCSEQNMNYSVNGNESGGNLAFDDLPFFEKLKKMFEKIVSDDDDNCDCCGETEAEEGISTYTAVSLWLGSIMKDMKEISPFSYFIPGASGSMEASEAVALISQDAELLEQAQNSGLLEVLMSNTNAPDEEGQEQEGIKSDVDNLEAELALLEEDKSTPAVEGTSGEGAEIIDIVDSMKRDVLDAGLEIEKMAESVELILPAQGTVQGSLQLNVESEVDIDEFIRKSKNVDLEKAKSEPSVENAKVPSVGNTETPPEDLVTVVEEKSEGVVSAGKDKSDKQVGKEKSENQVPPPEEVNDILSAFGMTMDDIQEEDSSADMT